jgi:DUF438 domain-containing protein
MTSLRSPSNSEPRTEGIPDSAPQTTPKAIGYGHPEYNFVQGLMELQKSSVRMETVLEGVQKTLEDTKAKVARFEKIVYVATGTLAVVILVGGWMINSAKDVAIMYIKANLDSQAKPTVPMQATPSKSK